MIESRGLGLILLFVSFLHPNDNFLCAASQPKERKNSMFSSLAARQNAICASCISRVARKIVPGVRTFLSKTEFESWSKAVVESRKETNLVPVDQGRDIAPFLCDVNPFAEQRLLFAKGVGKKGTSSYATVQATWPITTDEVLAKDVNHSSSWSSFRLGKFYEALDALTADSAYLHTDGHGRGLALVTAGHYFSRKLQRTAYDKDVTLRCYPIATGNSSIEIRTDGIQDGKLINFCHTVMVCVDANTHRPVKGMVPPLEDDPDDDRQLQRAELAKIHARVRKTRAEQTVSLYTRHLTHPPSDAEMQEIHNMHRHAIQHPGSVATVADHTHSSMLVLFPEQRNIHGKTFGGFVMAQAFDLAYMAATYFMKGKPFMSLGIDEASFLQPITIGDMVNFQYRVVHTDPTTGVFRVSINVDLLDQNHPDARSMARTNYLRFVFAGNDIESLLPVSYSEILGYVNSARRHAVEPVASATFQDFQDFLANSEEIPPSPPSDT